MEHINLIFEKKMTLLNMTKKLYEDALNNGYPLIKIIELDNEAQENNLKILETFQAYDPFKKMSDDNIKNTANMIEKSKNYENDEFKNLITEKINDNYSFGKYGDFKIIICNENGYVNGTQLLKQALISENSIRLKINKNLLKTAQMDHWFSLKETNELLEMVSFEESINKNQLIFVIKGSKKGEEIIRGTYIHPTLVNSLATWMSPCYAIKINKLVNELNISAQKKALEAIKNENKNYCNIIEQMREEYNKISLKNKIIFRKNKIEFKEVMGKLKDTVSELKITSNNLNKAVGLIDEIKYDSLYIYKIKIDNNSDTFYTSYRILKENKKKITAKHKNYIIVNKIYKKHSVNSTKAWKEFKKDKNKIHIKTRDRFYNDFTFLNNYNEENLKNDLDQLFKKFDNLDI